MFSKNMTELGRKRSSIREIFEYGRRRAAQIGAENIYDFSLGNPSVPAPEAIRDAIFKVLNDEGPVRTHSYTSAPGDDAVRAAIASSLNRRFGCAYRAENLYMTVGAAAAISICFKALAEPGDEFIAIAPFFPEYRCFVEQGAGAKFIVIDADIEHFQIDFAKLAQTITPHTKAIIVNSPSNPSGAVYSEATIRALSSLLEQKSKEYGHPIFIISDEPYREVIYDGISLPFVANYYRDTFVCYSYSKSLSLPGERIGYIAMSEKMTDYASAYAAVCGAGRILGYVNAPSLFQRVAAACTDLTSDISIYEKNRNLLYDGLTGMGFFCVKPEGAFYLFPRSLEPDAAAFCERAKKYELLFVPGDDFGCPGHVRISYCVPTRQIERALPLFQKLANEYAPL